VEIVQHISDNDLDNFAMQTLPKPEAGPLVEHLVVCQSCRERLDAEIEFVTAMRGAEEGGMPRRLYRVTLRKP
jgi:hypothetical protein